MTKIIKKIALGANKLGSKAVSKIKSFGDKRKAKKAAEAKFRRDHPALYRFAPKTAAKLQKYDAGRPLDKIIRRNMKNLEKNLSKIKLS